MIFLKEKASFGFYFISSPFFYISSLGLIELDKHKMQKITFT